VPHQSPSTSLQICSSIICKFSFWDCFVIQKKYKCLVKCSRNLIRYLDALKIPLPFYSLGSLFESGTKIASYVQDSEWSYIYKPFFHHVLCKYSAQIVSDHSTYKYRTNNDTIYMKEMNGHVSFITYGCMRHWKWHQHKHQNMNVP